MCIHKCESNNLEKHFSFGDPKIAPIIALTQRTNHQRDSSVSKVRTLDTVVIRNSCKMFIIVYVKSIVYAEVYKHQLALLRVAMASYSTSSQKRDWQLSEEQLTAMREEACAKRSGLISLIVLIIP